MNVLSLFSGYGGLDMGLEMVFPDAKPVCFCEIEPYAQKILEKRFPGVPIMEDVYDLQGHGLIEEGIKIDLITGGFPCQPFSHAGKRKGSADNRYLFDEIVRLAIELGKPRLFLENVTGLLSIKSYQCLCGWPHRWGGVNNDREIFKQIYRLLHSASRSRDDKVRAYLEGTAIDLWWGNCFDAKEDSQMERSTCLAYLRNICRFVPSSDSSIFEVEGKSRMGRNHTSSHVGTEKNKGAMDRTDEGVCKKTKKGNASVKPERTKPKVRSWSNCQACGRRMDNSTDRHVPVFPEILRTLSEVGYRDIRWGVIGACHAGAPHRRERVFILAHPNDEREPVIPIDGE